MFNKLNFWKMFGSCKGFTTNDIPDTLIGEKVTMNLSSMVGSDSVRVDGTINGDVTVSNTVTIGETGKVYGNILAQSVTIAGIVVGDVNSDTIIYMSATARVVGRVRAKNVVIDEGAKIDGNYLIGDPEKDFTFVPVTNLSLKGQHILE